MEDLEQRAESGIKGVIKKTGRVLKHQIRIVGVSLFGGFAMSGLATGVTYMILPLVSVMTGTTELAERMYEGSLGKSMFLYGGCGLSALGFLVLEGNYLYHCALRDVDDVFD